MEKRMGKLVKVQEKSERKEGRGNLRGIRRSRRLSSSVPAGSALWAMAGGARAGHSYPSQKIGSISLYISLSHFDQLGSLFLLLTLSFTWIVLSPSNAQLVFRHFYLLAKLLPSSTSSPNEQCLYFQKSPIKDLYPRKTRGVFQAPPPFYFFRLPSTALWVFHYNTSQRNQKRKGRKNGQEKCKKLYSSFTQVLSLTCCFPFSSFLSRGGEFSLSCFCRPSKTKILWFIKGLKWTVK